MKQLPKKFNYKILSLYFYIIEGCKRPENESGWVNVPDLFKWEIVELERIGLIERSRYREMVNSVLIKDPQKTLETYEGILDGFRKAIERGDSRFQFNVAFNLEDFYKDKNDER